MVRGVEEVRLTEREVDGGLEEGAGLARVALARGGDEWELRACERVS